MNVEALQSIAITAACERSVDCVLGNIALGLSRQPNVALVRIWLIGPGDICEECPMRTECPNQEQCLHLTASAGQSLDEEKESWNRVNGRFRRFPLGVRKVGHIGATGQSLLLNNVHETCEWLENPAWAKGEGIQSFAGHPLMYRGEILGVLGVFSREKLSKESLFVLRTFADRAAAAISNARAWEEVERLRHQLELENEYLREEVRHVTQIGDMVGESPALQKILHQVAMVAPTDSTVLIEGESGTGKELIARAIHEGSARKERPIIRVNCAAIPQELFESEFFGHVQGAFTGALRDRVGRFELAHRGTLLLDEVGEIPLELQGKLLRVLQEGEIERVGEGTPRKVDVRLIAATNRDLQADVKAGRFRQDLYYRLSVFPISVPPLRERAEDIPLLADHFLEEYARRVGKPKPALKQRHVIQLQHYDWPGNIRELQNVLERAVIVSPPGGLVLDLPGGMNEAVHAERGNGGHEAAIYTYDELKQLERDNIIAALEATGWKVSGKGGAAERLGVKPTTLASRIKALDIKKSA